MPIDTAPVVAALKKVAPDGAPEVSATDAALVLRYDAAAFGARCSADDAALRALKSLKLGGAEQADAPGAVVVRYALAQ